jgi:hypothetical protein
VTSSGNGFPPPNQQQKLTNTGNTFIIYHFSLNRFLFTKFKFFFFWEFGLWGEMEDDGCGPRNFCVFCWPRWMREKHLFSISTPFGNNQNNILNISLKKRCV